MRRRKSAAGVPPEPDGVGMSNVARRIQPGSAVLMRSTRLPVNAALDSSVMSSIAKVASAVRDLGASGSPATSGL